MILQVRIPVRFVLVQRRRPLQRRAQYQALYLSRTIFVPGLRAADLPATPRVGRTVPELNDANLREVPVRG